MGKRRHLLTYYRRKQLWDFVSPSVHNQLEGHSPSLPHNVRAQRAKEPSPPTALVRSDMR